MNNENLVIIGGLPPESENIILTVLLFCAFAFF